MCDSDKPVSPIHGEAIAYLIFWRDHKVTYPLSCTFRNWGQASIYLDKARKHDPNAFIIPVYLEGEKYVV